MTYDWVVEFENALKARLGAPTTPLTLVILPTNRARLLPMVVEVADIADDARRAESKRIRLHPRDRRS